MYQKIFCKKERRFDKVQTILSDKKAKGKPQRFRKHPYLVCGITHCAA